MQDMFETQLEWNPSDSSFFRSDAILSYNFKSKAKSDNKTRKWKVSDIYVDTVMI